MRHRCPTSIAPVRLVALAIALLTGAAAAEERTDIYGDPLPDRVLARLGTTRLQQAGVHLVRFSPDGKVLAAAGKKTAVRFWDMATGKETRTLGGITEDVEDLAFAPDGKLLAVASAGRVSFFDTASGVKSPWEARQLFCTRLVFSPDGKVLACGGDRDILLCDTATGKQIGHWEAHEQGIRVLAFTPDGKGLVSSGLSQRAQRRDQPPQYTYCLWDTGSGQKRAEVPLPGHLDTPMPWGFPDGKTWTVQCYDLLAEGYVLWQPAIGKELAGFQEKIDRVLTTSLDGKTAAGLSNQAIDFWDVPTGKRFERLPPEFDPLPGGVALSPDGRTFAFIDAGDHLAIRLWDIKTRTTRLKFETHGCPISSVAVAPNGRTVATGSEDGSVRLWDMATGKPLRHLYDVEQSRRGTRKDPGKITHLAFTPDGQQLVTGHQGTMIQIWDVASGKLVKTFGSGGYPTTEIFRTFLVAAGGKDLILATANQVCRLDLATRRQVNLFYLASRPYGCAVAPDGRLAVRVERTGRLMFQDVDNPKKMREIKLKFADRGGQPDIGGIAFSPEGLLVMVVGRGRIWFLDAATGNELAQFSHTVRDFTHGVAFSPDGRWLRLSDQRRHHLLDAITGKEVWSTDAAGPVAFRSDSKALVAADLSRTALVWDLAGLLPAEGAAEVKPQAARMRALWAELGGSDGLQAYAAFRRLHAEPQAAIALLRGELGRTAKAEEERIGRLLRDLNDDKFTVRQKASDELAGLGVRAAAALSKALEGTPPLEVRHRVEKLLLRLNAPETEQRVRLAIKLLEIAGTREAYRLLQELAEGTADSSATKEASASLQRLPRPRE